MQVAGLLGELQWNPRGIVQGIAGNGLVCAGHGRGRGFPNSQSSEHRFGENNGILHPVQENSGVDHGAEWAKRRTAFWMILANQAAVQ